MPDTDSIPPTLGENAYEDSNIFMGLEEELCRSATTLTKWLQIRGTSIGVSSHAPSRKEAR
jgi:hypothetical protein